MLQRCQNVLEPKLSSQARLKSEFVSNFGDPQNPGFPTDSGVRRHGVDVVQGMGKTDVDAPQRQESSFTAFGLDFRTAISPTCGRFERLRETPPFIYSSSLQ